MGEQTKSTRMQSLLALYDMHSTFFIKALDGISDEDAHNRLGTKANHVAWLAGSLVESRYWIANDAGIDIHQRAYELFKDGKGIQDGLVYPPLQQFRDDWMEISPITRKAYIDVSDEQLDEMQEMGGMKMSLFDMVSFTIYREANCIGQIALWRRLLDYPALKYD